MTGSSPHGADPPHASVERGQVDVLSEMLRTVRLSGSVFFQARLSAPFGLTLPRHFDTEAPASRYRHLSLFHLIGSGGCIIETSDGIQHQVSAGDIVLMPFSDEHHFLAGNPNTRVKTRDLLGPRGVGGITSARYGGGGEETQLVCGFIESSEFIGAPVFRTLPNILIQTTQVADTLLASSARQILGLLEGDAPGAQMLLGRLMEVLFVEVLRQHISRLPANSVGWLAAIGDPIVGRALVLMHNAPRQHWTMDTLTSAVGTSKTVLAERFNNLLGRPPIDYLIRWRLQLAADRLRTSQEPVGTLANEAGYDSAPAFSRAFKRVIGVTPAEWRGRLS